MRGILHQEPVSPHFYEEMEFPEPDLPLDFQEAFGFLDSMDSGAGNPVCSCLCDDEGGVSLQPFSPEKNISSN